MKTLNKDLLATQLAQAIEQLQNIDNQSLIEIYNEYANYNSYDMIYDNDESTINDIYDNAYDAVRVTNHKGYNDNQEYFTYNDYGLMVSFDYLDDDLCPIDVTELAEWLISEDKLIEYDISVTTLEDLLASIEDNITDDEEMLVKLVNDLGIDIDINSDFSVDDTMKEISNYNYESLLTIITHININY